MSYDHNDIYNIVERLAILEGRITPTNVKHGLNKQQKSVPQLPALFKPKDISPVLGSKKDPEHPMHGYMVGDSVENDKEPVEEAVANEDVLDKVKASFADYLKTVADEIKTDTDLKDKKHEDSDLKKKDKKDRDLVAKEADVTTLEADDSEAVEEDQTFKPGDRVRVIAPNHYEDRVGEVVELSPSGKFIVLDFDGDEASMHVSDIEPSDEVGDEDDWYDEETLDEDPTADDAAVEAPPAPVENPVMPESAPVKTVTNECGLWEIHGNEPTGFEIRHGNNAMRSKFKSIDEAVMALEMFAARKKAQDESQDYIEEA